MRDSKAYSRFLTFRLAVGDLTIFSVLAFACLDAVLKVAAAILRVQ